MEAPLINLRRAIASEAKPLVGLYSESGCGKTKSSLLLAKGFTGDMSKVGMLETESGRGEAYADDAIVGGYNVISIRSDFSPKAYGQAISAAEQAALQCLIIDSASHEWEGVNGVLAQAAKNQEDGKKGPLVWQRPKMDHAREFMLRLTQTSIPLVIVCMRAKYPMEEVERNGKKEWMRSTVLSPKQSEDILYEMFIHGWIDQAHRFHGTKYTLDEMRAIFLDGEPITVDTGRRLAAWAAGGATASAPREAAAATAGGAPPSSQPPSAADLITKHQALDLEVLCKDAGVSVTSFLRKAGIAALEQLPAADFPDAVAALKSRAEQHTQGARQ